MPGLGTIIVLAKTLFGWIFRAALTFISAPSNIVIGALIFGVAFTWGNFKGKYRERHKWEALIASERRSQSIITDAQEAKAAKDLKELQDERDTLNSQLETILAEARADADAARVCFGPNSLQRTNRGRKGKP